MFKLSNDYPIEKLLKRVQWNARIMFIMYAIFIGSGVINIIFIIQKDNFWLLFPVFMGACLILFAPFLFYNYFQNKQNIYSIFTLSEQNSNIIHTLDQKIIKSEKIGERLGISNEYIFSLKSSFYIPFAIPIDHINTVYFKRRWGKRSIGPNIYIITKTGKHYKLPLGAKLLSTANKNRPLDAWILTRIHNHAPKIILGFKYGCNKNLKQLF